MSDIERFQQEGRAAARKFFADVRGFVDHMLYLLEDRLDTILRCFQCCDVKEYFIGDVGMAGRF